MGMIEEKEIFVYESSEEAKRTLLERSEAFKFENWPFPVIYLNSDSQNLRREEIYIDIMFRMGEYDPLFHLFHKRLIQVLDKGNDPNRNDFLMLREIRKKRVKEGVEKILIDNLDIYLVVSGTGLNWEELQDIYDELVYKYSQEKL